MEPAYQPRANPVPGGGVAPAYPGRPIVAAGGILPGRTGIRQSRWIYFLIGFILILVIILAVILVLKVKESNAEKLKNAGVSVVIGGLNLTIDKSALKDIESCLRQDRISEECSLYFAKKGADELCLKVTPTLRDSCYYNHALMNLNGENCAKIRNISLKSNCNMYFDYNVNFVEAAG